MIGQEDDAESDDDRRKDIEAAKNLVLQSISGNTKKKYEQKLNNLRKYVAKKYPECIDVTTNRLCVERLEDPLPLPDNVIIGFLGSEEKVKNGKHKDKSRAPKDLCCFKSAIVYLYSRNNVEFNASFEMKNFLGSYLKGAARKRAHEVMICDDEERSISGKAHFTKKQFIYLCKMAHKTVKDPAIDCYQIYCWNLIARSVSVGSIEWMHLSWEMDHLNVNMITHKGDQEGIEHNTKLVI
jgi:hypothetical protein